jgi:malate synthase
MKVQAAIRGFLMEWELRNRTEHALRSYRSELGVVARWLEGEGIVNVPTINEQL